MLLPTGVFETLLKWIFDHEPLPHLTCHFVSFDFPVVLDQPVMSSFLPWPHLCSPFYDELAPAICRSITLVRKSVFLLFFWGYCVSCIFKSCAVLQPFQSPHSLGMKSLFSYSLRCILHRLLKNSYLLLRVNQVFS